MDYKKVTVPIPEEAIIRKSGSRAGQVYIVISKAYDKSTRRVSQERRVIGTALENGTEMVCNSNYRLTFPALYAKYTGTPEAVGGYLRCGMYVAALAIATRIGIYGLLSRMHGPLIANFVMDFAVYEIISGSNVAQHFQSDMDGRVLFSDKLRDDGWISGFFKNSLDEQDIAAFNDEWARLCAKEGLGDVWISMDGSNNDCSIKDAKGGETGHSKSGKNGRIISYMTAVSAGTGRTIAYRVYRGGRVDCKELLDMIAYLGSFGIKTEGVILDRGFCDKEDIDCLEGEGLDYILMLKKNTSGFQAMYRMHAEDIRMEVSHCIDSDDRCETFGIAGKARLFGDSEGESTVALFYNARKGAAKACEYIREVKRIRKEAEEQAAMGKEAVIPAKYRKILSVSDRDGKVSVEPDAKELQRNVDRKGFSAIGSSRDLGADEINRIYHSRDASEKGFRSFKTDLGDDAMRTHFDSSMQTKFLVGFIASNIRNEFQKACKRAGQPTNRAKRELELLAVNALPDGSFKYVHTENTRQLEILGELGVDPRNLEEVAADLQKRKQTGDLDQRRSMTDYFQPAKPENEREGGESTQAEGKTAEAGEVGIPEVPKKKGRGRPPGSKNKKTIEREAREAAEKAARQAAGKPKPEKKRKGRKPGSAGKEPKSI